MFEQSLIRAKTFIKPATISCNSLKGSRSMATKLPLRKAAKENHKMKHPDAANIKEQKEFDENKEKLEKLEHGDKNTDFKKPSMEELQKRGDDARIEQNRPDDGVY